MLRNIKTYSGINYIPITHGHNFCGLVGINGIGKSSVLESFDTVFNNRPWNFNLITRKSGMSTTTPYIVPIFLLKHSDISPVNIELAKKLSDFVWEIEESDLLSQNKLHFKAFNEQRSFLKLSYPSDSYLLLPLGISHDGLPNLSIFNTRKLGDLLVKDFDKSNATIQEDDLSRFEPLFEEVKSLHEYIYIPKDIDAESFSQLENKEIQSLMGESLITIIESCVPARKIQEINTNLNQFIDLLSSTLGEYSFKTVGERQVNLRKMDVYKLIIEAYFKIRKLHKLENNHYLELSLLSSGEKQKAIIEIIHQLLKEYRSDSDNLIIAIDEPESSLHMAACFDQFNKLYIVSKMCKQLLFSTHWYGFIPSVEDGSVSVISKKDGQHNFDLISIPRYRESIKQFASDSKGKLPHDIKLKSTNDFVQSIISSVLIEDPYNWLICEGSSEKLYFDKYFEDLRHEKKLRIIPVGGANEIKRIYNYLQISFEDYKKEIKGTVVLLSDTDANLVTYPVRKDDKLKCLRIVMDKVTKQINLVGIDSNPVSPKTEIEDCLNGKLFHKSMLEFQSEYDYVSEIFKHSNTESEHLSYFYINATPNTEELVESFFNTGNNKYNFAKRYIENMNHEHSTPEWISKLASFF